MSRRAIHEIHFLHFSSDRGQKRNFRRQRVERELFDYRDSPKDKLLISPNSCVFVGRLVISHLSQPWITAFGTLMRGEVAGDDNTWCKETAKISDFGETRYFALSARGRMT